MALPDLGRATCSEWADLAAAHADAAAWAAALPVLGGIAALAVLVLVLVLVLEARAARRHADLLAALRDVPTRGDYHRDLAEALLRRDGRQ
jgi:hypothetical protein